MLVNKSMYPVRASYSAISKMNGQLGDLQTQLGSGQKYNTLAAMGNDVSISLALRGRLTKLDSYASNISTVNLRLSFLDQAFTALNGLKSEARTSATPTSYGENNLTMVSLQKSSQNRMQLLIEALNTNVGGRYLMGGNNTENPPVASYDEIMFGKGSAAGFNQVAEERRRADQGSTTAGTLANVGLPRTQIRGVHSNTLVVSSAQFERFGYQLTSISGNTDAMQTSGPTTRPLAPEVQVSAQPTNGEQITFTLTRPDGSMKTVVAQAATTPDPAALPKQFQIGPSLEDTMDSLEALLEDDAGPLQNYSKIASSDPDIKVIGTTDGSAAFSIRFNKQPLDGDVVSIGVKDKDGTTNTFSFRAVIGTPDPAADPAEYKIGADRSETLKNLEASIKEKIGGLSAPVTMGRLTASTTAGNVNLAEQSPATVFGYKLSSASTTSGKITVGAIAGSPASVNVQFMDKPRSGESVTIGLTMPDGTTEQIRLEAVDREPGVGQFVIGKDANETAANFEAALKLKIDDTSKTTLVASSTYAASQNFFNASGQPIQRVSGNPETATTLIDAAPGTTVDWYIGQDDGNPRLSATAQIDDSTKVGYGVRANETGLLELMRTMAAMSVQEYDVNDPTAKGRFSAMVSRQMDNLSSNTATKDGSVESIALELGVVKSTVGKITDRNTAYAGQLETLLADTEQVGMEETAMELLALKTRLEAAYQATASISQLSLVNYLK